MITGLTTAWGAFRLAGMPVALPLAALREVVPCGALRPLPATAACVVGACEVRGVLVPVVDLAPVLGQSPQARDGAVVVLTVHAGRMVGLLAEAVREMVLADDRALHRAHSVAGEPLLFAGSLQLPDAEVVSVIDLAGVAALPGVPTIDDPEPQRAAPADLSPQAGGADEAGESVMLLRCGSVAIGLDAACVEAAATQPTLRPTPLSGGACVGAIEHAGLRIAAVDLLQWCGLGTLGSEEPRRAIVVRMASGLVALMVSDVVDVVRLGASQLLPVPPCGLPQPHRFRGVSPDPAGGAPYLVLAPRAFEDDEVLLPLAQTNVRAQGAHAPSALAPARPSATAAAEGAALPVITFDLDAEVAAPIDQVRQVLVYRPRSRPLVDDGSLLDLVVERERSIPVVSLARLCGVAGDLGAQARVLVVEGAQGTVGFAVPALRAIDAASGAHELPDTGSGTAAHERRVAFVGQGENQRTLRLLDLQAIATRLSGTCPPTALRRDLPATSPSFRVTERECAAVQ